MSTITQLNSVSVLTANDLIPVYSNIDNDIRKASFGTVLNYIQSAIDFPTATLSTQYASPVTGGIVYVRDNWKSVWLIITPVGSLSALTLVLPLASTTLDQTEVTVLSMTAISTLTVTGNGATAVYGAPNTLAAGAQFKLKFDIATQNWYPFT